jgi:hypothetical protein
VVPRPVVPESLVSEASSQPDEGSEVFEGGCHCGAVRFQVTVRERRAVLCDCSICSNKGYLHVIVEAGDLQLLRGEDALSTYTFNTGVAKHHFCRNCGVHSFYVPRSHPEGFSVNLRCLDDVTPADFDIRNFDGSSWEENIDGLRASRP